jgi:hypothetical protein
MRGGVRASRKQATRAFEVVRRRHLRTREHQAQAVRPTSAVMATSPRTIERALLIIDGQPPVRIELVAAASARLAAGERPTSAAIADRAIRVAACDLV